METKTHLPPIELRPAVKGDAELLFSWRNDSVTRAAFHNSDELTFTHHLRWLNSTLTNEKRKLYVALVDGKPVGTVRADKEVVGWVLSWTIAPNSRGRGFGSAMVRCLTELLRSPVRAEIKKDNIASVKIAESVGMRFQKEEGNILYYSLSIDAISF